jgi:cysteine-rich repeat protein
VIFVGETPEDGIAILHQSHGTGHLAFGEDGTLLASNGDGASYGTTDLGSASETYWSQGLADGIIEPWENIGAFRSQLIESYSGNMLRLDPYTGEGVPSNPWFDADDPSSVQSRSFAVGLRNAYRFTKRPGTGSVDPADADPGVIYLGDVGWNLAEDLHILSTPGQNFGWPAFEGMFTRAGYWGASIDHIFAKNPLFGVGGCTQEYLYVYNLIVQDTLNTPSWPNPCDAGQQIPNQWTDPSDSTVYTYRKFMHSRPPVAWRGRSWVATYDGSGEADTMRIGEPGSPVAGPDLTGNASTGGVWYTGTDFPEAWRDTYFHADYGGGWIASFKVDENDQPFEVVEFLGPGKDVTFVATNPSTGGIYYVNWGNTVSEVRYLGVADGSTPPTAVATIDSPAGGYGPEPLTVNFRGSDSSDIDPGDSITYYWQFGDGADSTDTDPSHVYDPGDGQPAHWTVQLTVTDEHSNADSESLIVSVNNTPPSATITSPVDGALYDMVSPPPVDLNVSTSDLEHSAGELSCSWLVEHLHNDHTHPQPSIAGCSAQTTITPVGCDGNAHAWRFSVTVSDAAFLSTTTSVEMQADCSTLPGTPPFAVDDFANVAQGHSVDIDVLANDSDGDSAIDLTTVTEVTPPSHGSTFIDPVTGVITYTHDGTNNLVDEFSYVVSDEDGDPSNLASVFLTAFNNPPQVSISSPVHQSLYSDGQMLLFGAQGSDPEDGSAVSYDWEVQLIRDDQLVPGVYTFSGETPPLFETGVHGQPASAVSYLVGVTVTDLVGATASDEVRVNPASPPAGNAPPAASFTATPAFGSPPLLVDFDASASSDPDGDFITYEWDFGDGTGAVGLTPSHSYTESGSYLVQLTVVDSSGDSDLAAVLISVTGTGIEGTYFNDWSENGSGTLDLSNPALVRIDGNIAFDWGTGSPDPLIASDNFGVRWEGQIEPLYSEDYQFYTYSDDGVRLWIDGVLVVDHWLPQGSTERTGPAISLAAGVWYEIVMEYFENGGGAVAELRWESASQAKQTVPQAQLAPPEAAENPGPVAVDDVASVDPSSFVSVDVLANDVDENGEVDPTTVQVTSGPTSGSTSVDGVTGAITYTHGGTAVATDTFTYTVQDLNQAVSNEATVAITIDLGTPTITITSPSPAEQVPGHEVDVAYTIGADPATYDHVHLTLDQPPYADETTPDGVHSFQGVAYTAHTLLVQLVDANHRPLPNPEASAQVSFTSIPEAVCGDGVAEQQEECDDDNTLDGDCCSATCTYEAEGGACTDDANECTTDTCNATGTCMHASVPDGQTCADGDACTTPDTCSSGVCEGVPLPDNDGDLVCDLLDGDDDDDGVQDIQDSDPFDPYLCGDVDADGCEDCSSGTYDPFDDGPDFDSDGICESELYSVSSRDNTLYEDLEGDVSNGAGEHLFAGLAANGTLRRGLLGFDVAAVIPAGSIVHDVALTLNMSRTIADAEEVELYVVLADWGEAGSDAPGKEGAGTLARTGDATWLYNFMASSFWSAPGGDYAAAASASQTVGPQTGDYTWSSPQMAADVQGWLDDPSTDFGWMVVGDESPVTLSAQRFDSRENANPANRPQLWIHYSPSSQTAGGCCFASGSCGLHPTESSCTAQGGVYQGDATSCIPNTCAPPPVCGNDTLEGAEVCDGTADDACPGLCQGDCSCAPVSQIPMTFTDFHVPGTQIGDIPAGTIHESSVCEECHGNYDPDAEPFQTWNGSLMAQAGRDPLFFAQLTTANQDIANVGYYCMRCHVPMSIVTGHASEPNGGTLDSVDRDGVSCHLCHSMVDPDYKAGVSPPEDEAILSGLADVPTEFGNAMFVLDPAGLRRGPYSDSPAPHATTESPFHSTGDFCGTCHDVGNVAITKQPDGTYLYNAFDTESPTDDPHGQFPLERTYTEWKLSAFANGGVDMGGIFGGDGGGVVSTCQDCHMPRTASAQAASTGPVRSNMAVHEFAGASSWVLETIGKKYLGDPEVDQAAIAIGIQKATEMVQRSATLQLAQTLGAVDVRVTNESGHKLPTGHIEGRRVWVNVEFLDAADQQILEYGHYDSTEAELDEDSTVIFEMHIGLSPAAAAATGLPEGTTTHMGLADIITKDTRIPPRGFDNAAFEAAGAPVVATTYADGQYWNDSHFWVPEDAAKAVVNVYYQTVTRHYIEALRDGNVTDGRGQELHDLWEQTSKGAPVLITTAELAVAPVTRGDFDDDGDIDEDDAAQMEVWFTGPDAGPLTLLQAIGDFDGDDDIDCEDMSLFNAAWTGPGNRSDLCQPLGGCCAPDDMCSEVTEFACIAAGGSYCGDLTACAVDACAAAVCTVAPSPVPSLTPVGLTLVTILLGFIGWRRIDLARRQKGLRVAGR